MSSVRKEPGQFFSTSLNPGPLEVIAAVFGLLCIFISGLLGFVMLMEYNPEAKYFKENGTSKSAEIVSFQKTEPDRVRLEVRIEKEQGLYTTNSDYAAKLSHLKNGDMITVYVLAEKPGIAYMQFSMPHVPRGPKDFYFVAGFLFAGILLVLFAPEILIWGRTARPQQL